MAHHTQERTLSEAHKQTASRQLTVWDAFAIAAMQGLLSDGWGEEGAAEVAEKAANMASAMIVQRNAYARIAQGGNK